MARKKKGNGNPGEINENSQGDEQPKKKRKSRKGHVRHRHSKKHVRQVQPRR